MAKDKISVVTVCFNCVGTIEKTIRSVIGQTYSNLEYIIIDGGSTDGTLEIINKYKSHISVIVSEPDKGIYDAMNKGILVATGEWIHFRNSGDFFLHKDSVEKFFEKGVKEEVSVVHGNCLYFDNTGWYEQTPPILRVSYKQEIPVLHPAAFIRMAVQKGMMFDTSYRSSADYDFFYKCYEQGIVFEYRPLAIAAFARGGFSSNWERAFWEDCRLKGMTKSMTGKIQMYTTFIWKKVFNRLTEIKRNTPLLKRLHFHGNSESNAKTYHSLPVPSDF